MLYLPETPSVPTILANTSFLLYFALGIVVRAPLQASPQ
jgi:hypothetical protein